MDQTLKVVIPMAGRGTRLRPQTWSRPKQLISVAGKVVLDHVLSILSTLPNPGEYELINIVGYLGDQIAEHIRQNYPQVKSHFIVQDNPRGQSHAISLARQYLRGPMLMVFADTLIETDLGMLKDIRSDAVAWVKEVPDPRRFGVVEMGADGRVKRLIEKPEGLENNLAVVGFYYFKDSELLLEAIEEQMQRGLQLKGEFYLVDAINLLLERGLEMTVCPVDTWLDAGNPESLLETNRYLLNHGLDNSAEALLRPGVVVVPPVFIHPTAQVVDSIIGPNVSLGAGCQVRRSIIENSILEDDAQASGVILEGSLIGRQASLVRRSGMINAGDNTEVVF